MKNNIKIALIGGTKKSGKYLVKTLLTKIIRINLLVRDPKTFQNQNPLIEIKKVMFLIMKQCLGL